MAPQITVNIVDDEFAVRDMLTELLRASGFRVKAFASAREFLDGYEPAPPECLVSDAWMPGFSGLELRETLAARGIDMPVIMITGDHSLTMKPRSPAATAITFVAKPFHPNDLLDAVRLAIEKVVGTARPDPLRDGTCEPVASLLD